MIKSIVLSVALPALLGAAVLVFVQRLWRSQRLMADGGAASPASGRAWGYPAALLVSFLAAFLSEEGLPEGPAVQWPAWYALAIPLAAAAAISAVTSRWQAWHGMAAALIGGGLVAVVAGAAMRFPDVASRNWQLGLMAAAIVSTLCWQAVRRERQPGREPGRDALTFCAPAMLVFAALSILILESRFAKLALIFGGLSAFNGLALAIGLTGRRIRAGWGGAAAVGTLAPMAALCGYAYDYDLVPVASWVMVAAAPLAMAGVAFICRPGGATDSTTESHVSGEARPARTPLIRLLAPSIVVLLICGAAVGWALLRGSAGEGDAAYEYASALQHDPRQAGGPVVTLA